MFINDILNVSFIRVYAVLYMNLLIFFSNSLQLRFLIATTSINTNAIKLDCKILTDKNNYDDESFKYQIIKQSMLTVQKEISQQISIFFVIFLFRYTLKNRCCH